MTNSPRENLDNKWVFINCPFDNEYRALLRPMLFTICYLGFTPRIASDFLNSANNRIDKICRIIASANFSIHDLSRCRSLSANEFFRWNMPFEFGIDYGNSFFTHRDKKMLVLEGNRYDFQKTISDISGVDTKCHHNDPQKMIGCIRHWMIEAKILSEAKSPTSIWYSFTDFASDFYDKRKADGFSEDDLNDMPTNEYIEAIQNWVKQLPVIPKEQI